jgi:hypothetical protein
VKGAIQAATKPQLLLPYRGQKWVVLYGECFICVKKEGVQNGFGNFSLSHFT